MSIVTYLDIRDTAITHIKTSFARDKRIIIDAHPGIFDEAEIKRLMTRTPAILTSLMQIRDGNGMDVSWVDFVSWVLYRADNQDRLYDGAIKIVSALIPVIRNIDAEWSIGGGTDILGDCLYSGSLDKINVTLWAVKWSWQLRGALFDGADGGILLPDDLDYFEGYDADHLVGSQTIQDEVHLEVP